MQELTDLHEYYPLLNENIDKQDKKLKHLVETIPIGLLLKAIPGGMTASLCSAHISIATDFKSGRNIAALLGLAPAEYSRE
ncbi:conserved hypothetical protein [Alteromonas alvinellae]